jgi:integrase
MSIRRLPSGRYQADVSDARRGVQRTKRTFRTQKQAKEWEAAVIAQAHDHLLGRAERQPFGVALARYLAEDSTRKRSHRDDLDNATALRLPYWDAQRRAFATLEHLPMDAGPTGIVAGLAAWTADQRAILRRSRLQGERYQLRQGPQGPAWWHQPDPASAPRPPHRRPVAEAALCALLDVTPGQGPLADATLRIRQALVRRVLAVARKNWRLIDTDLASLIETAAPAQARVAYLTPDELTRLVIAAPPHLDDAILGAAWIGWRRANLIGDHDTRKGREVQGLTWERVVWPVYADGHLVTPGRLWYEAADAKNAHTHVQPMSDRVAQLLRTRWTLRSGPLVFHDGTGAPFGDFRRAWHTALKRAGLPASTRWHDLRHTWGTDLARAGVPDRHIQELGGWRDGAMVRRYSHLIADDLLESVNRPGAHP